MKAEIRLTPPEFEAMLERTLLPPTPVTSGANQYISTRYEFTIFPVTFWVKGEEWEQHRLRQIVHNCQAKWNDVLTEPTLVKLRALLAEPKEEPAT